MLSALFPFPPGSPEDKLLDCGMPARFINAAKAGTPLRVQIGNVVVDLDITEPTPVQWIRGLWVAIADAVFHGGPLPAAVASASWTTEDGEAVTVTSQPAAPVELSAPLALVGGAA